MLNQVTIMGRLTRDPELRRTGSGISVASFTLAVDRDYKPEDGERECDFIDCVAWRGTGEFVSKYFCKGQMAIVTGRLQVRSWADKEGNKRRSTEVIADSVYFGEPKKTSEDRRATQSGYGSDSEQNYGNYGSYGAYGGEYATLDDDDAKLTF